MECKPKLLKKPVLKSKVYERQVAEGQTVISDLGVDVKNNLFLNDYPEYSLEVAASCLITPDEGDRVAAIFDGQIFFLVSVLKKSATKKDIELDFKHSNLKVYASNIELNVGKRVTFDTSDYVVRAKTTEIYSNLSKYVYNEVYTVAYNSYRNVERTDEMRAKNFSIKVSDTYTLKNKIGVIQSDAILKIDGGQVHMG